MTTTRFNTLAALICAATTLASGQISSSQDGVTYSADTSAGTATVSLGSATALKASLTIPATVTIDKVECKVTKITDEAFKSLSAIETLTIEASGIEIGKNAFAECTGLKSVTISGTDVQIDNYAFYGCTELETVSVSGSISAIGQSAFYQNTALKSVDLPEGLTSISDYAFYECTSLASVSTPTTLTAIGKEAFRRCTSLTSLTLAEGLQTIGEEAFREDLLINNLNLPTTTQSIGKSAFYDNAGIKQITVPKGVSSLDEFCFYNCKGLENIYFEGGKLELIPNHALAGCEKLETVTIGDGVTMVDGYAFSGCKSLKSVTLPSTIEALGEDLFSGCTSLETVTIYAPEVPLVETSTFSSVPNAKIIVPKNESSYADAKENTFWEDDDDAYTFTDETTSGSDTRTISASDAGSFLDVFRAISANGDYANADASIKSDISFDETELAIDTLSARNIFTIMNAMPTIASYSGTLSGSVISNLAMRSTGLFGTIAEGAAIDGLVLEDAVLYVDPTDAGTYEVDGESVTIHVLARTSNGKVTNVGFSGDIIVDSDLADGKDISVCLVNETSDDSELNGYIRIGSLLGTGSSKRCITIKQNLGVKRPKGTLKMATSKSLDSGNKTLTGSFNYTEEELMKSVREFSDEEFAQGAVAYWLNYSGPGYTGDYTARWSQGKRVPVSATTVNGVSNALYAVDYGQTDLSHITSAPQFANNGSKITIVYDQKPAQVTVGGQAVTSYGEKSVTLTFDHTKPVNIAFSTSSTALPDAVQPAKAAVSVSGMCVTVTGAEGQAKTLYSMTGREVASTNGESLTAPGKGVYLLKVGSTALKVVLK